MESNLVYYSLPSNPKEILSLKVDQTRTLREFLCLVGKSNLNGQFKFHQSGRSITLEDDVKVGIENVLQMSCCLVGGIQIVVKTLTGRTQSFNFEPETPVLEVKQRLQEKEGIQVEQIRLIYAGKQLNDDKSLEFYKVGAGATIHMVLQLRGG